MKNKLKNLFLITLLVLTFFLCILYPDIYVRAAAQGLLQWYQHLLPVLFPFMILTSLIHMLHYDTLLSQKCSWFKKPWKHYSAEASFIILLGFFCGFPMGAKLVHDHYLDHKLNKKEALFLLSFCNNISPAFFLGIVLPVFNQMNIMSHAAFKTKIPYMFCMYGIPLLYGVFLQLFLKQKYESNTAKSKKEIPCEAMPFAEALDIALTQNIMPIVKLGCYIMIFQIYSTYLTTLLEKYHFNSRIMKAVLCSALEIVNGSLQFRQSHLVGILPSAAFFFLLHFGGLSCIMQTSIFLQGTDIKLTDYICHKIIIGLISSLSFVLLCIIL